MEDEAGREEAWLENGGSRTLGIWFPCLGLGRRRGVDERDGSILYHCLLTLYSIPRYRVEMRSEPSLLPDALLSRVCTSHS